MVLPSAGRPGAVGQRQIHRIGKNDDDDDGDDDDDDDDYAFVRHVFQMGGR